MYELRPLDRSRAGLEGTSAFLNRVWPEARFLTADYLDWQYNRNPTGPAVGCNAFDADGGMVAHFTLVPVEIWLEGEARRGLVAFNVSTHPDHRGRGVFKQAGEQTYAWAREAGYDFFYGVTNALSTPVFEKWGAQVVCPLEVRVGLGPPPPRGDEGERHFMRIWRPETLAWRLSDPQRRYFALRSGERVSLFAPSGRVGIHSDMGSYEVDAVPPTTRPLRSLQPLRLWMGVDASRDWSRSRYVVLPRRLRPVPLILMFFDLSLEGPRRKLDPALVRFDALDFDAF